jgi:hypothetical protein
MTQAMVGDPRFAVQMSRFPVETQHRHAEAPAAEHVGINKTRSPPLRSYQIR